MKSILLFIFFFIFMSSNTYAQEDNFFSITKPIRINITAEDAEAVADVVFFLGGTRTDLEGDNFLDFTDEMLNRLRINFGCEKIRGYYELGGESRLCLYKNDRGDYTITGFVADKTVRSANYGPTRSTGERIGLRGERHFIYDFVIGAEVGYEEYKLKHVNKTYGKSNGEFIALTISRPLEVRKKSHRSADTRTNVSYVKMLEARELQENFLEQLNEEDALAAK